MTPKERAGCVAVGLALLLPNGYLFNLGTRLNQVEDRGATNAAAIERIANEQIARANRIASLEAEMHASIGRLARIEDKIDKLAERLGK